MCIPLWLFIFLATLSLGMVVQLIILFVHNFLNHTPLEIVRDDSIARKMHFNYVLSVWARLGCAGPGGAPMRIAVFGAGLHSRWLLATTSAKCVKGPNVVAVIDEQNVDSTLWDMKPIKPSDLDIATVDAIFISSDRFSTELAMRCKKYYGNKIEIIDIYENLGNGPFEKNWDYLT